MDEKTVKAKIEIALRMLYSKDYILIKNTVHERTVCAQLKCYLEISFDNHNVDVEYNKYNYVGKNKTKRWKPNPQAKETPFYPDIIIHGRDIKERNLVAIEVKKEKKEGNLSQEEKDHDIKKLRFLKNDEKYKYKYAFFIILCDTIDETMQNIEQI